MIGTDKEMKRSYLHFYGLNFKYRLAVDFFVYNTNSDFVINDLNK